MIPTHIGRVFTHATNRDLCNVVKTSKDDEATVQMYAGTGTIDDFLRFLEVEEIECIVEWERPRHWPKGRP
jgi:hypothetical protein